MILQGNWGFLHLGESLKHGLDLSEKLMIVQQFRNITVGLKNPSAASNYPEIR